MTDIHTAKQFSRVKGRLLLPIKEVSDRDFMVEIELPLFAPWKVGQFLMLQWGTHIIGRPFAIVDWQKKSDELSHLTLWFRILGAGTADLRQYLKQNAEVFVTLPLGSVPQEILKAKRILFISGGVGAATIWPMARERKKQKYQDFWVHGERNQSSLVQALNPDTVFIEEDPGSFEKGRVTQIFDEGALPKPHKVSDFEMMVICGPSPMLQAIQKMAISFNIPCYMGLEEKMACGLGLCFSCSVKSLEGMQRCCLEGPWFEARQIPKHFEFRVGASAK